MKAALCDLGDPGWGGSLVSALSCVASHTPQLAHGVFVACLVFLLIVWASVIMAHKMSVCMHRDDTKLSPLALIVFVSPINWTCHVTAPWCVLFFGLFVFEFVFCLCLVVFVVFCCLCFLVLRLVFLMSVTWHRTMYRSSTSLLLRPLQQRPLRGIIHQLTPIATCSETC